MVRFQIRVPPQAFDDATILPEGTIFGPHAFSTVISADDLLPEPIRMAAPNGTTLVDHIQALRRYAKALVGNHADADDLVQEALKRALTYIEGDRQIDNLRGYLFTILHNVRKDALRKQTREGIQVPVDDMLLVLDAASPSDRVACNQVIRAMQQLSEGHRQVLLQIGVEGMSYREAAEILGLPIGTVMSRLSRARAALREILDFEAPLEIEQHS